MEQLNLFVTDVMLSKKSELNFINNHAYGAEWATQNLRMRKVQLVKQLKKGSFKNNYYVRLWWIKGINFRMRVLSDAPQIKAI